MNSGPLAPIDPVAESGETAAIVSTTPFAATAAVLDSAALHPGCGEVACRRHIICFGNELHGDDGFGPAVHRLLAAGPLSPGWQLFLAGSRGLDALALFEGCDAAVVVDAAAPAGRPGRLDLPPADEIGIESALPGHGAGVGYLLRALLALEGRMPRLRLVTAEMAAVTPFRPGLSAPVASAAEAAAALLRRWMAAPDGFGKPIATHREEGEP